MGRKLKVPIYTVIFGYAYNNALHLYAGKENVLLLTTAGIYSMPYIQMHLSEPGV